jgi:two-component sensor histidine kinase
LGLQIVRSLVEQDLRGALTFISSGTQGCEVRMDVPWSG